MPRRTLWLILCAIVISVACYERADHNPYGRWFSEVMETIDRTYVERVDDQKLFEGALNGMIGRLDEYSAYLPRSESPQLIEALDQKYGGVGIEVSLEGPKKQLTVMSPLIGTPAYKAGIRPGDQIVAINGRSTENLPLKEVVGTLRGKVGEEVTLSVHREAQEKPIDFHLVRALIKTDSILGDRREADGSWNYFLPDTDHIGYVRVNSFGSNTVAEFQAAMKWLKSHDCRGMILDLRNNPGGLLQAAVGMCEELVPRGALIVSTRGRDEQERERFVASGRGAYQKLPLVVLVNDKSASAAEIVAACLQDDGRATVVGTRSWGKGTVQNVIPLEGARSALKLTVATYWRPSGKNIHRTGASQEGDEWGVKPTAGYEVPLDEKREIVVLEEGRRRDVLPIGGSTANKPTTGDERQPGLRTDFDPQLKRALQAMEEKLADTAKASAA